VLDPDLWGYRIAHDLICEPLLRRRRTSAQGAGAGPGLSGPQGLEELEGVLAERVRIDGDGRGVDIWVRRGVRFHDGRPLTAHDVRATLEMVLHSAQSAPRTQALLADVARLGLVDKDVVHVDLRRPARAFLAALTEIDILPAAYFANGRMLYQPFNRRPVCTGPFRLAEWKRGSSLTLRRAPGYWGPQPATDELRFLIAPDGARGLSRLRQGEADGVLRVPARYLTEQVEPAAQRGRWVAVERDANQVVALLWNGRHGVTGQAAVRQALAGLLDRGRLLREVRAGLGTQVALPPLVAALPGPAPPLSAEQANARLDAAGLVRLGPGGPRTVAGRPLRLRVLVPAGSFELAEVARHLAEYAARLGLKLEPEVLELGELLLRLRRGAFETALLAWAWTGSDPRPEHELDLLPLIRLGLTETDPLLAELGPLLQRAREGEPDGTARLQALWQQHEPVTLLYRPRQVFVLSPSVQSAGAAAPGQLRFAGDFLDLRALFLLPPGAAAPSLLGTRPQAP
jgi:peptide/nickel transport system substrate-binding protein